ncbi:MAG TPA: HAD-IA family hydrolase [Methylomirabilota bacterium]|nr:HAD-IA family hydrolase [Methylomirabilota bacterium]
MPSAPTGSVIKALTIDFWGTLLLDSPSADERYRQQRLSGLHAVLNAMGFRVGLDDLKRAYASSGRELQRRWRTRRDIPVEKAVETILRSVSLTLPEAIGAAGLAELVRVYSTPPLAVPPTFDPSAPEALGELKLRGLSLAIVSNTMRTPGAILKKILDQRGLFEYFSTLTFSDECGIRKPDPEIFRLTLERLGVAPEEAVHVGDDPVLDVEGAKAAGMRVIQMAIEGSEPAAVAPDAVIERLAELPTALDALDEAEASGSGSAPGSLALTSG